MTPVANLIQAVERSRATLLDTVVDVTDEQASFRPAEGHWSIAEVLEHLYLAELSGVSKIWAALKKVTAGDEWTGARPHAGKSIEDVVATTWKQQDVAPPIATPHIGGPLEFWVAATRSLPALLDELGQQLEGTALDAVVFPHYLSGPLDARQRLEFLRFHIDRHLQQIAAIRGAPGFPGSSALPFRSQ